MTNHEDLLAISDSLAGSSYRTTQAAEQVKAIKVQLVEIASQQRSTVQTALAGSQKVQDKVRGLVDRATGSQSLLNESVGALSDGLTKLQDITNIVGQVSSNVSAINQIAFQSKILALNASVEASRAGQYGKGFSVVAQEIKKLADQTKELSDSIDAVVSDIKDQVTGLLAENRSLFDRANSAINSASMALNELMKSYSSNDGEAETVMGVLGHLDNVSSSVGAIDNIAREMDAAAEDLNKEVETANLLVSEMIGVVKGDPITDLQPKEAFERLSEFQLIDVRRPDEYTGELGHVENTILATLGPELTEKLQSLDRSRPSLFICRSGGRSSKAAREAQALGFANVYNLEGGMLEWNKQGLPVV